MMKIFSLPALLLMILGFSTQVIADNYVTAGSKAAGLESCVEETSFMRSDHMELILHQRDETVHRGIRTNKHSLHGCIDCHVSYDDKKQPVAINGEGQFCEACHVKAAVSMDCFQCHATVPRDRKAGMPESHKHSQYIPANAKERELANMLVKPLD